MNIAPAIKISFDIDLPPYSLVDIAQLMRDQDNFIIFGTGALAIKVKCLLETKYKKNVSAFVEYDQYKIIDKRLDHVPVCHINEINLETYVMVIASYHEIEVARYLMRIYGMKYYKNFLFFDHILMLDHEFYYDGFGLEFYHFFQKNKRLFQEAFDVLSDVCSRDVYVKLIKARALAFSPEILELPTDLTTQKEYEKKAMGYGATLNKIMPLSLRENVAFKIALDPYSYHDKVSPRHKKIILNVGAYNNTSIMFSYFSPHGVVYAFEPQEKVHQDNVRLSEIYKNIVPVQAGIWSRTGEVAFDINESDVTGSTASSINAQGKTTIKVYSIDDFVLENGLQGVDFIKMDIEGGEVEALKGAQNVIRDFGPDLAISIYHKADHLYAIPLLIKKLNPRYNIYIDHRYYNLTETVCFATIENQ